MSKNFTQNPAAAPLTGAEIMAMIQGGIDVKVVLSAILALAWDRDDHIGTQAIATITGLQSELNDKAADSAVVHDTGDETIAGVKTFSSPPVVPTATAAGHAINKAQAESLVPSGTTITGTRPPAKVLGTTNQNVAALALPGPIDGYQPVNGDRVLLVGQTTGSQNGLWTVHSSLGWQRPSDFSTGSDQAGAAVNIAAGAVYKGSTWVLNSTSSVSVGTTAQTWTQDITAVRLTGNQTIAGTKTFSSAPAVPDNSWTISDTASLQTTLDAKLALTGTQTAAGDKTFTGSVIVKNDAVFDVRGATGWDPIAANNDTAFANALAAALAAGGGRVLLPPLLKIANLNDVGAGVDLEGRGSRQTGGASEIRCTAIGAGVRFADLTTPQSGGVSRGFRVNGNSVATQPFRLGLIVGRTFHNIDIDSADDVGLLLQGAANCTFIEVNVQNCDLDACRVDRAAGNTFLRCEFGNAGRYQLNLMSGGSALPFLTDYPQNNTFYGCFFEYHESTTTVQVYQGAGINNMLSDCIISTDTSPSVPALRLVKIEKAGTPFSTDLKLRDCTLQFNFTHASTVAAEIGDNTRLILSGSTSIVNAGTGVKNATNGALEADRIITSGVTTLKATTSGGLAYMRIRPDFSDSIACTSVGGVDRCLPIYVGGVFQGYVAVGQTPA